MDAVELAKTIREYFRITLNTDIFQIDILKSNLDKTTKKWNVEVVVKAFYGSGKTYKLSVDDQSGDITAVEAITNEQ